jgi:membrane dipeptidase
MNPMTSVPVFDGHNDVLLRLWMKANGREALDFVEGDGLGHMDLPRMKAGHMAGGLFAAFAPSRELSLPDDDHLNPPLADRVPQVAALRVTLEMARILQDVESASRGTFKICRSAADARLCLASGVTAAIFHIEGAEAIDPELTALDQLHALGLRSLGPVWSRPNAFGHGVPFRYPSTGDIGPGLTPLGQELVRRCNERRIAVDLSHLNENGFWDVARLSNAPLIASHSNAFFICAASRNLSDAQIKAIGASGGIIGLNFATGFVRSDGHWNESTPIDALLRHLDHLLELAGEDCVGFGSDFDGARIPREIGGAGGLPKLIDAMRAHGYGEALIAKIAHGNWLHVLEKTWGA